MRLAQALGRSNRRSELRVLGRFRCRSSPPPSRTPLSYEPTFRPVSPLLIPRTLSSGAGARQSQLVPAVQLDRDRSRLQIRLRIWYPEGLVSSSDLRQGAWHTSRRLTYR